MRAIDADALLGKFSFYDGVRIPEKDIDGFHNTMSYHDVKDEIRKAPTITPADDWIPCAERLPDEGQEVLFQVECDMQGGDLYGIYKGRYKNGTFWIEEYDHKSHLGAEVETVLAWQKSPAPWTGEKKGENG